MKVNVNICEDDIDLLVISSLKDAYRMNAIPNKIDNSEENIEPDYAFLQSVDHVLEYYLNAEELKEWELEKKEL